MARPFLDRMVFIWPFYVSTHRGDSRRRSNGAVVFIVRSKINFESTSGRYVKASWDYRSHLENFSKESFYHSKTCSYVILRWFRVWTYFVFVTKLNIRGENSEKDWFFHFSKANDNFPSVFSSDRRKNHCDYPRDVLSIHTGHGESYERIRIHLSPTIETLQPRWTVEVHTVWIQTSFKFDFLGK